MDLIPVSNNTFNGVAVQTVNARDLYAFLESKQEFANWIKGRIDQYGFVDGVDFTVDKFINGRATVIDYHISLDMAKELSMVERNEKGKQARQYFLECERQSKALLPRTFAEALRLAADLEEQKALALAERDHAISTKSEIGSRREATAMNTASQATKLANKLAVELDQSRAYATVKRMSMLYHGIRFDWRMLKEAASHIGQPPVDVFDANYGTVKAYHAEVWREAYGVEIGQ